MLSKRSCQKTRCSGADLWSLHASSRPAMPDVEKGPVIKAGGMANVKQLL